VAALLYAASATCEAVALCLDSPFDDLVSLCKSFLEKYRLMDNLFGEFMFQKFSKTVQEMANFKLEFCDLLTHVTRIEMSNR
jgi:hypothetical protein